MAEKSAMNTLKIRHVVFSICKPFFFNTVLQCQVQTMAKTFILSDESINTYGFRVITNGINLSQFKKNPVMLFNHKQWGDTYSGPIGKWENIRIEDGKLLADAVFDEKDDLAQKIASKVEDGFIKGASIGFTTIETSVEPNVLVKGQTRPTVTKALIYEASIVDLPGNMSALALYDSAGNKIELSTNAGNQLNEVLPLIQNSNNMSNLKLAAATLAILSLSTTSTEGDVDTAVKQLSDKNAELENKLKKFETQRATDLVQAAIDSKKIKEADKENWLKMASTDFDLAQKTLSSLSGVKLPNEVITPQNSRSISERANWTLKDWQQKDYAGLMQLKKDEPDAYKVLTEKAVLEAKFDK